MKRKTINAWPGGETGNRGGENKALSKAAANAKAAGEMTCRRQRRRNAAAKSYGESRAENKSACGQSSALGMAPRINHHLCAGQISNAALILCLCWPMLLQIFTYIYAIGSSAEMAACK